MSSIEDLMKQWEKVTDRWHEVVTPMNFAVGLASVRVLAAHCLAIAPDATHMLIETSDQGRHMCPPHQLEREGTSLDARDALQEADEVNDLGQIASWMTWGDRSWMQFVDTAHPFTNNHGGYYALDLRRIVADTSV